MSTLVNFRSRRRAWGHRVLGLYVVAWIVVILQPCAVAGEMEHGCPHCPPEMVHEANDLVVMDGSECAIGTQLSAESRSLHHKDAASKVPAAISVDLLALQAGNPNFRHLADTSVPIRPSGPPLNVLHCIYLK